MKLRNCVALAALLLLVGIPAFASRAHKNARVHHYNNHVKYHGHHSQHHPRGHHKLG